MRGIPHRLATVSCVAIALATSCWNPLAHGADEPEVPAARLTVDFDPDWRFLRGDAAESQSSDFDDSSWQRIAVPHDWSIAGPFDEANPASGEGGFLPTGVAWYRKRFAAPDEWRGKRVLVEFDGVMADSEVWINGHSLGHRPLGYVSFQYDLTDHLRYGDDGPNVLAVRTDTSKQVASRWYSGSGIYRHVRMTVVDPLHIEYSGIGITTPIITPERAVVGVAVDLANQSEAKQAYRVDVRILDDADQVVATGNCAGEIDSGATDAAHCELAIDNPRLWDVDQPAMYSAVVTLSRGDQPVDETATPFGIRTAEFRPATGFWLNGRNLKIKGVCLHHCAGAFGAAVPLSVWEYRLTQLQNLGVNAVRTAHNPVAPEFLDLCDRLGILVMDEFFDCWTVGKRKYDYHLHFREWAHRDMRDTILRDRNHPSVILYSVGNEIHDTPKEELAKRILRDLVDVCHGSDPTRPVTQALFRPNVSHDYDNGLADMLDVIGTNYRDLELLQAWRDDPQRKIIGTEQGHERSTWLACRDNPQHAGQFLWVGIDYLGESRMWPVTTYNAGLLDRTGRVHPRGYERQSWWSDAPMVHVFRRVAATEATPTDPGYEAVEWRRRQVLFDDWTPRNSQPHQEIVEVYSNCDEVELFRNGKSFGVKSLPADARPRTWEIDYAAGQLTAIGRNDGHEVARHELHTAGEAHHIELSTHRDELAPNWDDVAVVTARVVDEDGTPLPRSDVEVEFSVQGPGQIAVVDNGSIVSHEPFQATRRRAFQGQCTAYVKALDAPGEIKVTAAADGLAPGAVTIRAVR
ncbi:MAG: DUF4982 domain-containing protein [Planctomycetales bacterium]|nr:DUF4982 domain-containing protein [Planctomycetales bacterium]